MISGAEVISTDFDGIIEEGKNLQLYKEHCCKSSMIRMVWRRSNGFTENGIHQLVGISAGQAILAAKAGATHVAIHWQGRWYTGWDGMDLIHQLRQIFDIQDSKPRYWQHLSGTRITLQNVLKPALMYVHARWILSSVCSSNTDIRLWEFYGRNAKRDAW